MLKALSRLDVPIDTTLEQLVALIRPMVITLSITFTFEDLHLKGPCLLHITIQTLGMRVPVVLVDNGSVHNVCPL